MNYIWIGSWQLKNLKFNCICENCRNGKVLIKPLLHLELLSKVRKNYDQLSAEGLLTKILFYFFINLAENGRNCDARVGKNSTPKHCQRGEKGCWINIELLAGFILHGSLSHLMEGCIYVILSLY